MDEYTKGFHISAIRTAVKTGARQCVLIDAPFADELPDMTDRIPFIRASRGTLEKQYADGDFSPEKKTVFCVCSVTPSLDLAAFNGVLQSIASLSSDGSSLVLDYDDTSAYAAHPYAERDMPLSAEAFGLMLSLQGFVIYEYIASGETHPRLVHAVRRR